MRGGAAGGVEAGEGTRGSQSKATTAWILARAWPASASEKVGSGRGLDERMLGKLPKIPG